ncbi:MAG: RNA polymerase sigma factor [Alphaproteobacteria bacterium]
MPDRHPGDTAFRTQLIGLLPRLRRFAHGLAKSADEGDDLVQAACIRALERQHQWQEGTRLDSWLYRIIQTIWLDRIRATRVRQDYASGPAQDIMPALVVDGTRAAEAQLTLNRVRSLIDALPAVQRAVLLLVGVEGFSYREAAEALEIPTGTVMSRLARARAALDDQIRDKTSPVPPAAVRSVSDVPA